MPEVVTGAGFAGAILEDHELRVIREPAAARERVWLHRPEVLGERDLGRRGQRLAANSEHDVLEKGGPDALHARRIQRLRQIDAAHLRAERRAQFAYFHSEAPIYRCRSASVYSNRPVDPARMWRIVA